MSQIIVGLDIGHYSIKALRLRASYKGFEVLSFDEEVLDSVTAAPTLASPDEQDRDTTQGPSEQDLEDALHAAQDEALHTALVELRRRGALDGALTAVALPPDLVLSSRLRFPFTDDKQLNAVIPSDFEERCPVDIQQLILRHTLVGPSPVAEGLNDVLVAAVKSSDLDVFLDLWRAGGVDPHFVEMGDAAMLRLAPYLLRELREPFALVDIGHRFTRVICVEPLDDQRWAPGYIRSFQAGGQDVTRALAELLDCSSEDAEHFKHRRGFISVATLAHGVEEVKVSDAIKRASSPLVRELRRTFQAHLDERRKPVTQALVCGGGARLRGLLPFLHEELGLPFEPLPVAGDELAALPDAPRELMAQALALALREAPLPGPRLDLNFRVGRFEHKGARGWFQERVAGLIVIAALLLCALGALFGTRYFAASQQYDASKEALEATTERLFGEKTTSDKKVRDLLGGTQDDTSLLPKRNAYDFFFEVYSRSPADVKIEIADLDVDIFRQLIKVQAWTDSAGNVDSYVESLEQFPCFKGQVQKGSTNAVGDKVKFDLTIAPECPENKKPDKNAKKK
jgi:Tfp pilus assembly PilM family ATPase/cell division protein FtsB